MHGRDFHLSQQARYSVIMSATLYIGTSGWHYNDWLGRFYPESVKGYKELTYHSQIFNSVENNSSFYRIASEQAYKTWDQMTPEGYKFSLKLNKSITHIHRLLLSADVRERVTYILDTTQVLGDKLGAILIQLPASFKIDLPRLEAFLDYFTHEVRRRAQPLDIAIEFRHKGWFIDDTYKLLKQYNVALVAAQSKRWPGTRQLTADIAYIRMHGPGRLFASSYSKKELEGWASYIRQLSSHTKKIYVYFNNDFHGYAIQNAKQLKSLLGQ